MAGSQDRDPAAQNKSILTLFDPQSHTPRGYVYTVNFVSCMLNVLHCFSQSGLGDLGIAGLEDFIESLTCTQICHRLKLASKRDIKAHIESIKVHIEERFSDGNNTEDNQPLEPASEGEMSA